MVPEAWVKRWVDYSAKYGMGYGLSNQAMGVYFNDSTKIIMDPNGHHVQYMERRQGERQDTTTSFTLDEYPPELKKKVTLLTHFKTYLENDSKCENTEQGGGQHGYPTPTTTSKTKLLD